MKPLQTLELGRDLEAAAIPADVPEFLRMLRRPTMILQAGEDSSRTRVLTTLLHGNEPSGVRAVHAWLRADRRPRFDTLFLIGTVETALIPPGFAHRIAPGGFDFNRCWLPPFEGDEASVAQAALRVMRESNVESLIDIHNNTGHNPPYGVGPAAGAAELNLVSLFGQRFVHSSLRLGTLVETSPCSRPCSRFGSRRIRPSALVSHPDLEWFPRFRALAPPGLPLRFAGD